MNEKNTAESVVIVSFNRLEKLKYTLVLNSNTGGSGRFYEGEKYALSLNPDWIYIADDDAYSAPDMMESFFNFESDFLNAKIAAKRVIKI